MAINITEQKNTLLHIISKYYKFIGFLLVVLIILLSYYFFLKSSFDGYQQKSREITRERVALEEQKIRQVELRQAIQDYKGMAKENLDAIAGFLPAEQDLPGLITEIDYLAEKSGFLVAAMDITKSGKSYNELPKLGILNVSVRLNNGDYPMLKKFLTAVEENLRLMDVNDVKFVPGAPSQIINLSTYYLPSI